MSLDLAGKSGVVYSTSAITDVTGFTDTIFNASELDGAAQYVVKIDTALGGVDLSAIAAPSTFVFLADGDQVTFIKSTPDSNRVVLDDQTPGANLNGFTGVIFNYINQPGESITLIVDKSNDQWGVQI